MIYNSHPLLKGMTCVIFLSCAQVIYLCGPQACMYILGKSLGQLIQLICAMQANSLQLINHPWHSNMKRATESRLELQGQEGTK